MYLKEITIKAKLIKFFDELKKTEMDEISSFHLKKSIYTYCG